MSAAPIPQGVDRFTAEVAGLSAGAYPYPHMRDDDAGKWVRYTDHAAALVASEVRVAEYMDIIERGRQHWKDQSERAEAAEQSLAGLRAFAQDVMETWPEAAPDGFDLQEYAEKHGLLRSVEMSAPCGEDCGCTEYLTADDWPAPCFRRTSLLTGRPESDAAIDALLPKGEGETS